MTQMPVHLAAAVAIGLSAYAYAQPARAAEPVGTWLTEDGRARVRTERCPSDQSRLCGYVVWLQKPLDDDGKPRVDRYNPDARKQGRPSLGHQILLGLKPNADGRFEGKIYNGDNGKLYDVTVWSDTSNELSLKGCMLAVFCGSQTWARVSDLLPSQLQASTGAPNGPRPDQEWAAKGPAPATLGKTRPPESQASPPR